MPRARSALTVVVLLTAALAAACGAESSSPAAGSFTPRTPGVLTVVTSEVPRPGFWEGAPDHLTGGLEYELAKAVAERLGLKTVRVKIVRFGQIVTGHLDGADLAMDLITPTTERTRSLTFSAPYLDSPPTVVVRSGSSVADLETAQKLRWGAVRATTFIGIINTLITPHSPLRIYDTTADLVAALEHGDIDAILLDMPLAVVTAVRSEGRLRAAAQLPDQMNIAAALPKGSGNEQAVSSAFRALAADGTIDRLLRVWVGSSAADAEHSIPLLETTR